ncbi:D-glucuronyl C5-epimerase family protein [Priestia megaterium]|uniref:D-glucuronyl C5-epimerase family protein n=1 Tax=Priestia megaterium TaxID=1404 RepID=UPI003D06EB8F
MSIHMPEFTRRLATVSKDRYKIKFLEDGYPGKDLENMVVPHPIYGIYVIRDYLFQYKKTKDPLYKTAAITVANAAIQRMDLFKNSLVFWYKEKSPLNSSDRDYYSGLTQSYYAEVLAKLFVVTGIEKYKTAAQKVYYSLKIPVLEGRTLNETSKGPSIEEYPTSPNGYILNGWLSAISAVKTYANLLQDKEAHTFWRENLAALIKLLPSYDAPQFKNSRYTLNRHTNIKISSSINNIELQKTIVHIPGDKNYELNLSNNKDYEGVIVSSSVVIKGEKILFKNNQLILNVLLSRYSYPSENELYVKVVSQEKGTLQLSIAQPEYSPTRMITPEKYILIKEVAIEKGINEIKLKMYWINLDDLGVTTTFKKLGDKWHNVYHFIHINRLEEFYKVINNDDLLKYIEKWKSYVSSWSDNPLYAHLETRPYKGR